MDVAVVLVVCGVIASIIAGNKNRSPVGWFFAGLLLGPLGFILAFVMPKLDPQPYVSPRYTSTRVTRTTEKICGECKRIVPADSAFCPYCSVKFVEEPAASKPKDSEIFGRCHICGFPKTPAVPMCPHCFPHYYANGVPKDQLVEAQRNFEDHYRLSRKGFLSKR